MNALTDSPGWRRGTLLTTHWVQLSAARVVPGALAALMLVLPWYRYRLMYHQGSEDIFFELRDIFIFISDIPALLAVLAWLFTPFPRRIRQLPLWLLIAGALLAGWATLSTFWAPQPNYAAYQAARLWLCIAVFLVVATVREVHPVVAWSLVLSGALQAGIGIAQFALQRTLGLRDLGEISALPAMQGASVVTVEGFRTLRAYGLTQHPNLLGGILAVTTLLALGLALSSGRKRAVLAGFLAAVNFAGLLYTFSRAAWLGFAAGALIALALLVWRRALPRRSLATLALVLALVGGYFAITQWPRLVPRLGLTTEGVEIRSADERVILEAAAWSLILTRPLTGHGYGNFAIALWQNQPAFLVAYPIFQPVHRVHLLAFAELGVPGLAFWLALAAGPWIAIVLARRRWPDAGPTGQLAVAVAGGLAVLTVVGFFDFYPWFSQQGRLLTWTCLGMLAPTLRLAPAMGVAPTPSTGT